MKRKLQLLFLLLVLIIFSKLQVNAQTNSEWQPVGQTADGSGRIDGVETFFQINECNGKNVIYIRFINRNNYSIKLEWFDAVLTQELNWIFKDKLADKKSLIINANSDLAGECSVSSGNVLKQSTHPVLLIEMKNFVVDKNNFNQYFATSLSSTIIK